MDVPLYCNVFYYQGVIIRPGLCPFCLGDESMLHKSRLTQFIQKCDLQRHLQGHLTSFKNEELFCPHPKCRRTIREASLMDHLENIHAITPVSPSVYGVGSKRGKRNVDSEEKRPPHKLQKTANNEVHSKQTDIFSYETEFENIDPGNEIVDGWEATWDDFFEKDIDLIPTTQEETLEAYVIDLDEFIKRNSSSV